MVKAELRKRIEALPARPGVYIFKDEPGKVLYIGKAINLRSRVRSYFAETDTRTQVPFLVARVRGIDFIVTGTEKEALILENNLIKKHQPRYNLRLRDDKTFFHVRLTTSEKFPRLLLARRPEKTRDDLIFGPFSSSKAVKQTIELLLKLFPLIRCTSRKFQYRPRPCVNFEIDKCLGACAGKVSEDDYQRSVRQVVKFLRGEGTELIPELEFEMQAASENMEFEKAARLRDQINAIRETLEKQRVEINIPVDRDVLGYYRVADRAVVFRLGYRRGILVLGHPRFIRRVQVPDREALASFLKQSYLGRNFIPPEIILPFPVDDQELIQESLSEQAGRKVELLVPERGEKAAEVLLANTNARQSLEASREKELLKLDALKGLQKILGLKNFPETIECYDISNLGGKLAAGSLVRFSHGEPDKSSYRRYRIKGLEEQNDYEMMKQVLSRRFRRAIEEKQELPDLIILDGGKGQLNIALKVLEDLGLSGMDVAALAKERQIGAPLSAELTRKPERVFMPGRKDALRIKHEPAKHLLVRVRDEAHRFALAYLHKLRRKSVTRSVLLDVPGIGDRK